tara:strand:+ start:2488 stop:3423 length:936 start_codon:yes stop_codon:yes gene_type:complete
MENIKLETTGQKHISTLATDIKHLIANISNGKPANITEKNMNVFLNNIKEAMLAWNTPPVKTDKEGQLRMSVIGKPARQLWYDKHSPKDRKDEDAGLNLKFLYGHIIEHLILYLAELSGHKIEDQQKKVEIDGISGHIDSKIDGEICDVKSASSFSFKKFQSGEIVGDDPFGYHAQLSGYETANGTKEGGFLVVDKSSGDICFYKPEDMAKPNVKSLIKNLRSALEKDTPPEKCYEFKTEKNGNKTLATGCMFCPHKWECHSDTNNGKGLRVFKYSNKNVMLADVVKQPLVEEITYEYEDQLKNYGKRTQA